MSKNFKIIKNSTFKDERGQLWTTWKKGLFNKVIFNHDKFSLSKKILSEVFTVILNLGKW